MKIIIVGAGEVGFHVASRLSLENKDVVLIEKNLAALRRVSEIWMCRLSKAAAAARLSLNGPA